jgi:hypothetical protein
LNKLDIVIPGLIIGVIIISGVFFLMEWQQEKVEWDLMSEEDQYFTKLAENLRKTDQTNCTELSQVFEINTNEIILDAIVMKQKELGC